MKKVLVVAPHPDDETLGCGGTLLKHKSRGDQIYWINVTNIKEENGYDADKVKTKNEQIAQVNKEFGFDEFIDMGLNQTRLDESALGEMVGQFAEIFQRIQPEIVILPYKFDVHSDHRTIFEAAYSCTKSFRYPFIKKVLMMEVLSETNFSVCTEGFSPNYFVDISDFMDKKIDIMKIYKQEMGAHPFPRSEESIRALGVLRGSTVGCQYAESFMVLRDVD